LLYGIAFHSERFADLPEANQYRDVLVDDSEKLPAALREAETLFATRQIRSWRWVPAVDQPLDALVPFLTRHGFARCDSHALLLTRWVGAPTEPGVRIVPARAVRAALREACGTPPSVVTGSPTQGARAAEAGLRSAAVEEWLDDPGLDAFVALAQGRGIAWCALHQVGDIGRLLGPTSPPGVTNHRGSVEGALVAHCLRLVQRLALPRICARVACVDRPQLALLESLGFARDAVMTEFVKEAPA